MSSGYKSSFMILYGVTVSDPAAWGGSAALLFSVSVIADYIRARRAARVDPATALRAE